VGKPRGGTTRKNPNVGGRIILRCILEKQNGLIWTGLIWLRIRNNGGLVHVNTVMNLRVQYVGKFLSS
jgi:hypothetical protein